MMCCNFRVTASPWVFIAGAAVTKTQTLNHRNIHLTVLGARRPRSRCGIGLAMPPLMAVGRVYFRPLF